jgi:hypothetical protein
MKKLCLLFFGVAGISTDIVWAGDACLFHEEMEKRPPPPGRKQQTHDAETHQGPQDRLLMEVAGNERN